MGSQRLSPHIAKIKKEDMSIRDASGTPMASCDSPTIRHHRTPSKRAGLLERYKMGNPLHKCQRRRRRHHRLVTSPYVPILANTSSLQPLTPSPVPTQITTFKINQTFAPYNTSEFFTPEVLRAWNEILPGTYHSPLSSTHLELHH